jgi:hypothetical protein
MNTLRHLRLGLRLQLAIYMYLKYLILKEAVLIIVKNLSLQLAQFAVRQASFVTKILQIKKKGTE